jgi:hypothetical protein
LDCRRERRGDRAEQALRSAEDDHQEGIDDESWPAVGPVEPIMVKALPATPAMPHPSPKVSVDAAVSIPTARSWCGSTTARTCSPQRLVEQERDDPGDQKPAP